MSVPAVLWLSPDGPVWRDDILVPSPPPLRYVVAILPPMGACWASDAPYMPTSLPKIQDVEFRLVMSNRHGAHYELCSRPPAGYRWTVHEKRIWAEKIGAESYD